MWLEIRHGRRENREGEFERIGFQGIGESVQGTLLHSCHSASLFHFKIFQLCFELHISSLIKKRNVRFRESNSGFLIVRSLWLLIKLT